MICRLYAAHPEEADNQPVTRTHAAAQQGQPAHQRSDDQKQTEADQRVAPGRGSENVIEAIHGRNYLPAARSRKRQDENRLRMGDVP